VKKLAFFALVLCLALPSFGQDPVRMKTDSVPAKAKVPAKKPPAQPPADGARRGSMVVDDSTKNVYGPTTTLWTTERDWFTGQNNYRPLDTSIVNFHRWTHVQKYNNQHQDLGNNGTAMNPIFPVAPESIGASSGFNSFGIFFKSNQIRIYDTKSPFTRWYLVWGSEGRAVTGAEFSRNITPKWNFSLSYRPVLSDKQINRIGKTDRQVISHYYDVSTTYATPKDHYKVLFAFQRIRHRVNENGGLTFVGQDSSYAKYFDENAIPNLTVARGQEQHNTIRIAQQLGIKTIQAYVITDYKRQKNWYRDRPASANSDFYDEIRIDSPEITLDSVTFTTFQNQIGLKGNFGVKNQFFYNGYYKVRTYSMVNRLLNEDTLALPMRDIEYYTGGELQYSFDSTQYLLASAELLQGGYSSLDATIVSRWVDASLQRRISKPTFLQTAYAGFFDLWDNSFKPVESVRASAFPKVRVGPISLAAGGTFTSFRNYIYFAQRDTFPGTDQTVLPQQTDRLASYIVPEVRADIAVLKKIHLRPQLLYSKILSDSADVLRIPKVFFNGQVAIETQMFKGNLEVQFGVDFHWHSAYKAMGYDVPTQTFYNQDKVVTPAYLLADVFLNGKMRRGRFFFKYYNIGQIITGVGFMPTPYYRGAPSLLDFGFDMLLFD
jgi:hypothetical protein